MSIEPRRYLGERIVFHALDRSDPGEKHRLLPFAWVLGNVVKEVWQRPFSDRFITNERCSRTFENFGGLFWKALVR
jgi:hypothetical protein